MLRKRVGTHRNEKNKNILRHEIQEKSRRNSKRRLGKGIKMNNNPWIWNCMQKWIEKTKWAKINIPIQNFQIKDKHFEWKSKNRANVVCEFKIDPILNSTSAFWIQDVSLWICSPNSKIKQLFCIFFSVLYIFGNTLLIKGCQMLFWDSLFDDGWISNFG